MKRKCLKCEYGYNPIYTYENERFDIQSCGYGLEDGAAAVGEFCPMTGKKLQNASEKTIKNTKRK